MNEKCELSEHFIEKYTNVFRVNDRSADLFVDVEPSEPDHRMCIYLPDTRSVRIIYRADKSDIAFIDAFWDDIVQFKRVIY